MSSVSWHIGWRNHSSSNHSPAGGNVSRWVVSPHGWLRSCLWGRGVSQWGSRVPPQLLRRVWLVTYGLILPCSVSLMSCQCYDPLSCLPTTLKSRHHCVPLQLCPTTVLVMSSYCYVQLVLSNYYCSALTMLHHVSVMSYHSYIPVLYVLFFISSLQLTN